MTNLTMRDLDAAGSFDARRSGVSMPERSTGEKAVAAAIFGALTVAIVALGSLINSAGMDWYDSLEQPSIAPSRRHVRHRLDDPLRDDRGVRLVGVESHHTARPRR